MGHVGPRGTRSPGTSHGDAAGHAQGRTRPTRPQCPLPPHGRRLQRRHHASRSATAPPKGQGCREHAQVTLAAGAPQQAPPTPRFRPVSQFRESARAARYTRLSPLLRPSPGTPEPPPRTRPFHLEGARLVQPPWSGAAPASPGPAGALCRLTAPCSRDSARCALRAGSCSSRGEIRRHAN